MLMELARLTITNNIIICYFDRKSKKPDLRSTKSHKILLLSTDDPARGRLTRETTHVYRCLKTKHANQVESWNQG